VQDLSRPLAGFTHVDMWVRSEGHHNVSKRTHLLSDIRVGVEGDGDRCLIAASGSNAPQDFAVAVFAEIKDHRAMQGEENTIEATTLDCGDDRIAKPLERRSLYLAARPRRRAEYVLDLPAMSLARIEEAGELRIGIASRVDGLVSKANETVLKCLFAGQEAAESIGLV
jgi:hypothetical protein